MNEIEVSAKKIEDAISQGLSQLNASTIADVDYEVLSYGGFLKKAKIRMRLKQNPVEKPAEVTVEKTVTATPKPERKEAKSKPEAASDFRSRRGTEQREPQKAAVELPPEKKQNNDKTPRQNNEPAPHNDNSNRSKPAEPKAKGDNRESAKPDNVRKPQPIKEQKEQKPQTEREPKPERELKPETTVSPEIIDTAREFLKGLFERMGLEVGIEAEGGTELNINLVCDEMKLIGYKGTTLDAITNLVGAVVNKGKNYIIVHVDNNNYHKDRENKLIELARKKADKCVRTGKKVFLDPMNNRDRKIIHSTLSDDDRITTRSKGQEPHRRVVIYPKIDKPQSMD